MGRVLGRGFFARDADVVARDLLGQVLVHETPQGRLACRIVETEAYFGPAGRNPQLAQRKDMPATLRRRLASEGDPASHSFSGVTQRNRVMYGAPGFWYVYLIYGMHECVNVVTGPEDVHEPQAVLLRAGEPVGDASASGPGKLTKAMGITRAHYGLDATAPPLYFERGKPAREVEATPRIGVVGAEDLKLRYLDADSEHVSRRVRERRSSRRAS